MKKRPCKGHYWIIHAGRDGMAHGVCQLCGAEKEFINTFAGISRSGTSHRVDKGMAQARREWRSNQPTIY